MDVPQRKSCYTYAECSLLGILHHELDKSEWSSYAGYLHQHLLLAIKAIT